MKFIHTSDWHIGKLVHGIHMTKDQRYILKSLIELIKEEEPDCLIIAGDLYDRSVPPVEAVELLDEVLTEIIVDLGVKVIAISGNHDSPYRVGFGSKILKDNGLHIFGNISKSIQPVVLEDEHGKVNIYPIPYTEPAVVRAIFDNDDLRTHDAAMKAIVDSLELGERNICVGHGFVTGVEPLLTSESERPLSIGGSDYISVDYFERFDYVALGHLHRPQKVKWDKVRYAGSLMKYSFSEAVQKKSVTVVEMDGKGEVTYQQKALSVLRDLRVIKGELDTLIDPEIATDTEDYVMAILTDRGELVDPIGKLRAVYPNVLRLERVQYDREAGELKTSAGGDFVSKNPYDLFVEFYENVSGEIFSEEKEEVSKEIFDAILKVERTAK